MAAPLRGLLIALFCASAILVAASPLDDESTAPSFLAVSAKTRVFSKDKMRHALSTESRTDRRNRHSLFAAPSAPSKLAHAGGLQGVTGAARALPNADNLCVMCQYLVERIRGEMLMEGIGGGIPFGMSPALVGVPQFQSLGEIDNPANAFPTPGSAPPMTPSPAGGAGGMGPPPGAGAPPAGAPAGPAGGAPPGAEGVFAEMESQVEEKGVADRRRNFMRFMQRVGTFNTKPAPSGGAPGGGAQHNRASFGGNVDNLVDLHRYKQAELLRFRPSSIRYANMYDGPLRAAQRAQRRYEEQQTNAVVYRVVEQVCSTYMPHSFLPACYGVISRYQVVVEGLQLKDRPDAICMDLNICTKDTYIASSVHNRENDG